MKKALGFIGLLLISFSGFAQDKTALLGKWSFKEVYEKETMEAEKAARVATMFAGMSMEFKENDALLDMMGKTESAAWQFSEKDPKTIVVTSKTGKVTEMNIIKLTEKELVLTFGKVATFVLDRP